MAVTALWKSEDDADLSGGFVNDASPHDGVMQIRNGSLVRLPGKRGKKDDISEARKDEVQKDEAYTDSAIATDCGTVSAAFIYLPDSAGESRLLALAADDGDAAARFEIAVTDAGHVVARHDGPGESQDFATRSGFAGEGDAMRVTFCWDTAEGGTYTVENLSSGATHALDVPASISLGVDAANGLGWHIDPDAIDGPDDDFGDEAGEGTGFSGEIDYVVVHDRAVAPGTLDDLADGPPGTEPSQDVTDSDVGNAPDAKASDPAVLDDAIASGPDQPVVTLTFEGSTASFANTLGYYHIDPETGQISGVGIAFADARPEFLGGDLLPGNSQVHFEIPQGALVGTFLVADGARHNDFLSLGEGEFAFRDADGAPASLSDAAPNLVHVAADGTETQITGDIWHSAGFDANLALNADSGVHLRGKSENDDGTWSFGFEDLPAGHWDGDYSDLLFSVDLSGTGGTFLNPDYMATGRVADDDPDPRFPDEDEAGFDALDEDGKEDDGGVKGVDGPFGPGDAPKADAQQEPVPATRASADGPESTDPTSGLVAATAAVKPVDEKQEAGEPKKVVPCFTPGTLIDTDEGRIPVEELLPGDRVLTRDHGYRPLQWVGHKQVTPAFLAARPEFAPVRIARGALGNCLPERDMLVSPQHRMLIAGSRAELLFGESEVLVAAKHLIGMTGITRASGAAVTYIHIMCDRHEIVRADGAWSETFQPGDLSLAGMDEDQRSELLALFPELVAGAGQRAYAAARLSLKAHEARVLMGI